MRAALVSQAMEHHQAGRLALAEPLYRQLLAKSPDDPNLLHLLGLTLAQSGRAEQGIELIRQAVRLMPVAPELRSNLAATFGSLGRHEEAAAELQEVLRITPGNVYALDNLGVALDYLGRFDESIAALQQAVAREPRFAEAWANLSNALRRAGRAAEALDAARKAVSLKPELPHAWFTLGAALHEQGRIELLEEAIYCYRRAIALHPGFAVTHVSLGLALLLQGKLDEGFREHEWRRDPRLIKPATASWDLSTTTGRPQIDLLGKTILLTSEGGLGNVIQFARYAPLVARWAASVVVSCQPALVPVLRQIKGIGQVISSDDTPPACDLQCPLMSLPAMLGGIPSQPYIQPDPALLEKWRDIVQQLPGPRIGVCWRGSQAVAAMRDRSIPPEHLRILADIPATLISLQEGEAPPEAPAIHVLSGLEPFSMQLCDVAAVMHHLDLVITCDTSIAHLAGAVGVPVWVALKHNACWRWMLDRDDTPWYPTARLFRQPRAGDWGSVLARMAQGLAGRV